MTKILKMFDIKMRTIESGRIFCRRVKLLSRNFQAKTRICERFSNFLSFRFQKCLICILSLKNFLEIRISWHSFSLQIKNKFICSKIKLANFSDHIRTCTYSLCYAHNWVYIQWQWKTRIREKDSFKMQISFIIFLIERRFYFIKRNWKSFAN